jgi:hypothetical protein
MQFVEIGSLQSQRKNQTGLQTICTPDVVDDANNVTVKSNEKLSLTFTANEYELQ